MAAAVARAEELEREREGAARLARLHGRAVETQAAALRAAEASLARKRADVLTANKARAAAEAALRQSIASRHADDLKVTPGLSIIIVVFDVTSFSLPRGKVRPADELQTLKIATILPLVGVARSKQEPINRRHGAHYLKCILPAEVKFLSTMYNSFINPSQHTNSVQSIEVHRGKCTLSVLTVLVQFEAEERKPF